MRELVIHKNSPVFVTKLMLGHLVGSISSKMTAGKLFPVNARAITGPAKMTLLLEAKKKACIDHQTKANPYYPHG